MILSKKQIEAVMALPASKRYEHFIKQIADWEEVWGLYLDGWALAADEDEIPAFPVWPAQEYASLCTGGDWERYEPKMIELDDFLNELLPVLNKDGVLISVFYLPQGVGVNVDPERLSSDIREELTKYE
jgi:hypothetical protein